MHNIPYVNVGHRNTHTITYTVTEMYSTSISVYMYCLTYGIDSIRSCPLCDLVHAGIEVDFVVTEFTVSETDPELQNVCVQIVRGAVESAGRNVEVNLITTDVTTFGEWGNEVLCTCIAILYVISYFVMFIYFCN